MLNRFFFLILLFLLTPLLIIISIIIIVEDGAPVFFKQKRLGLLSNEFEIIKFRTMLRSTPNLATDELNNPDKYVLKTGRFLRKLSLDELPNLLNILKGEMDFIGPRPSLPSQKELNIKREKLGIHKLKPGITGWAQINGRDEISIDKKIELDLYYLHNKSLLLDLKIIFKTIFKVFKTSNISH